MANGRADHRTPPDVMQLDSMLRREAAKDNQYQRKRKRGFFTVEHPMATGGSEPPSIRVPA